MKFNTKKLIALLFALCLITSSFVGSTLAKYTTKVSGSDTARVAKFGVELTVDANLFEKQYAGLDAISVKSDDDADVIAPGTTDDAVLFTIAGAPEVDVEVTVSLGAITMATLPSGDYNDYTVITDQNSDNVVDASDIIKFNLAEDYKPVKWTLKKNSTVVTNAASVALENVNLNVINDYLTNELSGEYDVEGPDNFADIVGNYELSWTWVFDGVNDKADTFMGQVAAGVEAAPAGYVANESFAFTLEVTQVD